MDQEVCHIIQAINDLDLDDIFMTRQFKSFKSFTLSQNEHVHSIMNHPIVYKDSHTSHSFGVAMKNAMFFYCL